MDFFDNLDKSKKLLYLIVLNPKLPVYLSWFTNNFTVSYNDFLLFYVVFFAAGAAVAEAEPEPYLWAELLSSAESSDTQYLAQCSVLNFSSKSANFCQKYALLCGKIVN